MASSKGHMLEELVREYFSKQGFFVLRSVPYRFEGEDVTDLDVWLYSRHAASVRIRAIVDVKNKKSPKAFERVLWVKGIQSALKCDRAIIATTDGSPKLVKYAQSQNISVLTKSFLDRLQKNLGHNKRFTLEEFVASIQENPAQKQDGDWLRILANAKSAVACGPGFPAFNKATLGFKFFAERAETRMQYRDQALRAAYLSAALACIALDGALERLIYESAEIRYQSILDGVTFGDNGDGQVQRGIESALNVLIESMPNGKAIAAQARENLNARVAQIRAEIIAEYFAREQNAHQLFSVAKELEEAAHARVHAEAVALSIEARSTLGLFCDFVEVKRTAVIQPVEKAKSEMTQSAPTTNSDESADIEVNASMSAYKDKDKQKTLI